MSLQTWKATKVGDYVTVLDLSFLLTSIIQPWLEIQCALGEGPYYSKEHNHLRFVVSTVEDISVKPWHRLISARTADDEVLGHR